MQVEIQFTHQGHSAVVGGFSPGDRIRCSEAVAAHLVNDAGCAIYTSKAPTSDPAQPTPAAAPPDFKPARKPRSQT